MLGREVYLAARSRYGSAYAKWQLLNPEYRKIARQQESDIGVSFLNPLGAPGGDDINNLWEFVYEFPGDCPLRFPAKEESAVCNSFPDWDLPDGDETIRDAWIAMTYMMFDRIDKTMELIARVIEQEACYQVGSGGHGGKFRN